MHAFHCILQQKIWPSGVSEILEKADALNSIAATCLTVIETKDWTATQFKEKVVNKLYVSVAS